MKMKVIKTISEMRKISASLRREDKKIGFVPTMGFLHEGHLSLIRKAKQTADIVVVSIFVNPTQFAPNEDLDKYPRDFAGDKKLCANEGVDIFFYPDEDEMYLASNKTYVITEELSTKLCGKSRPTHFRGVTTIVTKLFNIVQPDIAVFGQKDAQQCLIIKKMVNDLNFPIEILIVPTVRESDGLAMSSRNKYLSPSLRKDALVISRSLQFAKDKVESGEKESSKILDRILSEFNKVPTAKIDYISIVDSDTLESIEKINKNTLIAIAAYFGNTRLIDNLLV